MTPLWTAVGIDPGASGAVAWIDQCGQTFGLVLDTGDPTAVLDVLRPLVARMPNVHVGIEKVSAWPGAGVSGMFRFGGAFAVPQALCVALGLPFSLVLPGAWNDAAFEARTRPTDKAERKRAALRAARERWPGAPLSRAKDGAVAEALWIALVVARRQLLHASAEAVPS